MQTSSAKPSAARGRRLLNTFLFISAGVAAGPARAVQEPPFARPAHPEVVPLLRQPLPGGALELFPTAPKATLSAGLSVAEPPLAVPEAIDAFVAAPPGHKVTTADAVSLALTVTKPYGCYRTETEVKTIEPRRHLVTVNLIGRDDEPCVASRTEEKVEVDMGRLGEGRHTILVGDGARTHLTLTVDVTRGAQGLAE